MGLKSRGETGLGVLGIGRISFHLLCFNQWRLCRNPCCPLNILYSTHVFIGCSIFYLLADIFFRKALRAALILFPLLGIPNLLGALVRSADDPTSDDMCAYVLVNGMLHGFQVMSRISKPRGGWLEWYLTLIPSMYYAVCLSFTLTWRAGCIPEETWKLL